MSVDSLLSFSLFQSPGLPFRPSRNIRVVQSSGVNNPDLEIPGTFRNLYEDTKLVEKSHWTPGRPSSEDPEVWR